MVSRTSHWALNSGTKGLICRSIRLIMLGFAYKTNWNFKQKLVPPTWQCSISINTCQALYSKRMLMFEWNTPFIDYIGFPPLKCTLKAWRFEGIKGLHKNVSAVLKVIPKREFHKSSDSTSITMLSVQLLRGTILKTKVTWWPISWSHMSKGIFAIT